MRLARPVVISVLGAAAAIASLVLLIFDDPHLLRLGVVLALWSAAFAAIAHAWARQDHRRTEHSLQAVRTELERRDESVSAITA